MLQHISLLDPEGQHKAATPPCLNAPSCRRTSLLLGLSETPCPGHCPRPEPLACGQAQAHQAEAQWRDSREQGGGRPLWPSALGQKPLAWGKGWAHQGQDEKEDSREVADPGGLLRGGALGRLQLRVAREAAPEALRAAGQQRRVLRPLLLHLESRRTLQGRTQY